ncbi:efflux RND transporter permease subunit [Aestuariibacter halophilus]|uniref:Efflux RND transporter permease subunit n=1 Tax=Fluctibacter halophilus TaxID=226011 RepID=A0ABS8GC72_9ALTE|nr:efflux RND transporter permease subunit [Aestuariibacter halophilus]MCC2618103.1 efflux RND transporter permease subunit [Aestuariibacter halophilus]
MSHPSHSHPLDRVVARALEGGLPKLLFIASLLLGALALVMTPREEEPQIVVPMIDVHVQAPNLSAQQVARQVTQPLEQLLTQLPGVEHVYSASHDSRLTVTLRFYVGEDRQRALVNTYNKLFSNQHRIPAVVDNWMVRPVEVDDVPIVLLGLYSKVPDRYSDYELRRMALEIAPLLQRIENTSEVNIVGGRERQLQILLDRQAMNARQITAPQIVQALQRSNLLHKHGHLGFGDQQIQIESGDVLRTPEDVKNLAVASINGKLVYIRDIAEVVDGPAEPDHYQWLSHNTGDNADSQLPLVTLSIAKQRGSNAVTVANDVLDRMQTLQSTLLPDDVGVQVIRNYGETANEKVNNLTSSLAFAVFTVVVFIGVFLGWRPAVIVALAVPVCYGLTLLLDLTFGYTINRVTLFALILSLGLLVDDPITGIDNIARFLGMPGKDKSERIVAAMAEIRPALLMSTLTIILAFIPLAFITGMMGPYMAPMAFNVPVSVILSTVVAFTVTPWLAGRLLKANDDELAKASGTNLYTRLLQPMLSSPRQAKKVLWIMLVLFMLSAALPLFRLVPLKLLPFDNKNEVQVLIDLPETASLEDTAALARTLANQVQRLPEVETVAAYVGQPSPIDFNGMVRQYYQRQAPYLGELRLLLMDKTEREHQSHGVVLRLRELLAPYNRDGTVIRVVEVPPGPPVLSTLVAEVYAEPYVDASEHRAAALAVKQRFEAEPLVVEVDTSMTAEQPVKRFVLDKAKAAASGVSTDDINQSLAFLVDGLMAGVFQQEQDIEPVPLMVKLPFTERQDPSTLDSLMITGPVGARQQSSADGLTNAPVPLVSLAELGHWQSTVQSQPIMRKDLQEVIYVTAELSGRPPGEVIADILADMDNPDVQASDWQSRTFLSSGGTQSWSMPEGTSLVFSGEGEWRITVKVFRDMGIAFAFALAAIFVVLKYQTRSTALALIIMSAIPLTIIGIMPGFWLLNQFGERWIAGAPEPVLFTATAMIGMIALAGIVVRNALILVEFITLARQQGMDMVEALLQAGSVRMRPVLLTAGTTLLGNLVIILDPVFSGLALAIIFGIVASTAFTLFVVPVVYYLVFRNRPFTPESALQGDAS